MNKERKLQFRALQTGGRKEAQWGSRDFKFWIFRDYDDFGRKIGKYKINSKRRPFFFGEHLEFGVMSSTSICS